jgi:vacuolar-type H+-ATPase subunit E/Vma4
MATLEENIETLSQRMIQDANAAASKILAEANARAAEIRQGGQAQAEAERKAILDRARQERERLRSQAVANAQLKARNDQLEHSEQLLDDVFIDAREKISTVQHWNNYDEIAIFLLKDALTHLREYPVKVRVDATIKKMISEDQLATIARDLQVTVEAYSEFSQGTGVIVETVDGHLNYDNTLENRLSRMQSALRAPVFHILMGEQV